MTLQIDPQPSSPSLDDLPHWNWEDLETVLHRNLGETRQHSKVAHLLSATREMAPTLSSTDLLQEILALGAIIYSLTASTSRPSRPEAYLSG